MLFYYSGQYLLMHGAMHHSNLQHELDRFMKNSNSVTIPILSVGKQPTKYTAKQWDHGNGNGEEEFVLGLEKNRTE